LTSSSSFASLRRFFAPLGVGVNEENQFAILGLVSYSVGTLSKKKSNSKGEVRNNLLF
jgi:hypothetical protein